MTTATTSSTSTMMIHNDGNNVADSTTSTSTSPSGVQCENKNDVFANNNNNKNYKDYFRVRTITCFIQLEPNDFVQQQQPSSNMTTTSTTGTLLVEEKIRTASTFLQEAARILTEDGGYTVQTLRIATNPFGEYLGVHQYQQQLQFMNDSLKKYHITFCSLGYATNCEEINSYVIPILSTSDRFSCSALLPNPNDITMAKTIATAIVRISNTLFTNTSTSSSTDGRNHESNEVQEQQQPDGLGNFRFCCSANVKPYIPFFPAATAQSLKKKTDATTATATTTTNTANDTNKNNNFVSTIRFAIGLENGVLLHELLSVMNHNEFTKHFADTFQQEYIKALQPLNQLCIERLCSISTTSTTSTGTTATTTIEYMGIDTSFNPSLDTYGPVTENKNFQEGTDTNTIKQSPKSHHRGSIASAIESMNIVQDHIFGSTGTLTIVAAITRCIQSIPSNRIKTCGYRGIMLPVCEDHRLAQVTSTTIATHNKSSHHHRSLRISDLLSISQVCGVGIDTVPIAGTAADSTRTDDTLVDSTITTKNVVDVDTTLISTIVSLLLDVAAVAYRWDKSLTCRLLPMPNQTVGTYTNFDSPYMINSQILPIT